MINVIDKIRGAVIHKKDTCKIVAVSLTPAAMAAFTSIHAYAAEGSDTTSIRSTMTSSFTEIGSDILGFFGDILPIALPILGAGLVISVGIAIFKKVTKKTASG